MSTARPAAHLAIRLMTAAALAAALALPRAADACSVCACGDPLSDAGDAPAASGGLRLSLDVGTLRVESASEETAGDTNRLTQNTLRLAAAWSVSDQLNLVVAVPVTGKAMKTLGTGEKLSDETGLGDVDLGARWFFLRSADVGARRAQALGLSVGTSAPTGRRKDAALLDEHAQLGTGAWGPYAGLIYRAGVGDLGAVASVSARYRSENGDNYKYGNALLWSLQGEWDVTHRIGLAVGLDGRNAGVDTQDGAAVENTGGLVLAVTPAVSLTLPAGVSLTARAQFPVVKDLKGEQDVGPTFNVGLAWQVF